MCRRHFTSSGGVAVYIRTLESISTKTWTNSMAQTATRKRGRAATNSVDSDQPNSPKRPSTTKTTARPARPARPAKNRNPGRNVGGNNLQGVIKAAKKGRKGPIDAIEQIRARGDELILVIEDERRRFNDGQGRADGSLADSLAAECALHSHDPIAGCEAFEEAKRALQRFQSLATRYSAASNQETGPAEPRWMRWKQDVVDLTSLNGKAKKLARQIVEGHLAPTGWSELTAPQRNAEDPELAQIAMEIVEEAVPKGATTWGTAAAQLVNVYGSILKDTFD